MVSETDGGRTVRVGLIGAGMAGIDGLAVGDPVTAEQMLALFGHGLHPLAAENRERLAGPNLTEADYRAATRLGRRSGSTART